jgi:hypothetical protein
MLKDQRSGTFDKAVLENGPVLLGQSEVALVLL